MSARNEVMERRVVPLKPDGASPETQRRILLLGRGYEPIPIHAESKACYVKGWTSMGIGHRVIRAWETERADHESTGCRTGKLAVADVDLSNAEHAAAVSDVVQTTLGLCPYVRIGNKPGGALCYYNPHPIAKITVAGRAPGAGDNDKHELVEFLGTGQQLVTYGFHHGKGADYEWPEYDLLDSRLEDLPPVTPDMIREAAQAVVAALIERGFTDVKVTGSGLNVCLSSKASEGLTPVTPEWLCAMFEYAGRDCDMDEWIGWMCVWKYTPLIDPETGEPDEDFDRFEGFHEWSATGDHGNYEGVADCLQHWLSKGETDARSDGKTIASLVQEATANGYTGPVAWNPNAVPKTPAIEMLRGMAKDQTAVVVGDASGSGVANDDIPRDDIEPGENRWPALMFRGDAIAKIEPPVPLIPGYLISKGVTAALATRGHGKTVIVADMALQIANNGTWCGEPVMPGWHVIFLCGEDWQNTAGHIQAWCKRHNGGKVPESFTFFTDVPNLLARDNHDVSGLVETTRAHIPEGAPVLWVVDTWQRATTDGGQNEDHDMKGAFRNLEELAKSFDGAAIGCFHPPKNDAKTISGVAFQENATVGIWHIEKIAPDTAEGVRKLTVGRLKGRGEGNYKMFRFDSIGLGVRDYFDQELTGAVAHHIGGTGESAETAIERVRAQREKDAEAVEIVFEAVKGFLEDGKRVLNHNNAKSSAVQLKDLVTILENDHELALPGSGRKKAVAVRSYLDRLTSKVDGRLGYRERGKNGHGYATYFLVDRSE